MKVLLANGADLTIRDESGWTAFSMAATSGNSAALALLISHGVDPNEKMTMVKPC